jgi:hypothetical protein
MRTITEVRAMLQRHRLMARGKGAYCSRTAAKACALRPENPSHLLRRYLRQSQSWVCWLRRQTRRRWTRLHIGMCESAAIASRPLFASEQSRLNSPRSSSLICVPPAGAAPKLNGDEAIRSDQYVLICRRCVNCMCDTKEGNACCKKPRKARASCCTCFVRLRVVQVLRPLELPPRQLALLHCLSAVPDGHQVPRLIYGHI